MKEIDSVISDLEMLKNGTWIPDEKSCNASIELLEKVKVELSKLYTNENMKECWNAACAYTVGSHKDFKQIHPNFDDWIKQHKKNNGKT